MAANPKSPFGRLILIDAFKCQNQIDKAIEQADLLVETAEKPEHKEAYANLAAQMRAESTAITPSVLWQAFDDNEVAAEDTYKGKTLAVKGTIHAITTSPLGAPQVTFAVDKHAINRVVFEFAKDDRPQVGKLKKGQQVLLSGRCKGMTLKSVFLDEAKVIE
mgnify:FL=1